MNSTISRFTFGGHSTVLMRAAWLMFAALIGLFLLYWMKFAYNAYLAAMFPGQLEYSEGIIWQQARLIPGPRMYGDLQTYPFLVFHYTPIYHLIVHGLAKFGVPWLIAGRTVSILSTVALAVLVAAFVNECLSDYAISRDNRLAGAVTAGLLLVTLWPIQFWAYTMRMDMLALALEFLGMYLGLCSIRRSTQLGPAVLAFVLAVYTKQTVVLGAIATFTAALIYAPGRALRGAALTFVLGGAIFAILTFVTDGGFPRHIFFYNVSQFSWYAIYDKIVGSRIVPGYPIYLAIAIGAAATLAVRFFSSQLKAISAGQFIAGMYFFISTANLLSLGKTGGWTNYMIPWVCSWAILIGLTLGELGEIARRHGRPIYLLLFVVMLLAQAMVTPRFGDRRVVDPEFRHEYAELVDLVVRARKPVLSEDMVVLMLAGKEVPWEPSIITQLTQRGVFDERKAIRMIQAHEFSYIIRENGNFRNERFTPAMDAAITKAYPAQKTLARLRVLSPDGPSP